MRTTHSLEVVARCPVDDSHDVYRVTVTLDGDLPLPVEKILEAVHRHTAEPVYQEHLTALLAAELEAQVSTVGVHSGVRTECACP